uniref:Uncharacterized protein n=1 Tax=Cucumis sativus TaxID=3659 RepID=A0A0A0LNH3_CUCSA
MATRKKPEGGRESIGQRKKRGKSQIEWDEAEEEPGGIWAGLGRQSMSKKRDE